MGKKALERPHPENTSMSVFKKYLISRPKIMIRAGAYLLPPMLALSIAGILWEFWVRAADVPVYIVPPPSQVLAQLASEFGRFFNEGLITLFEAISGFAIGGIIALSGACLMAHSRLLERSLLPLAILVKVTPIVAIAPLFVIWFGFGPAPKILITALITFFPVLVNGVIGFRSVDRDTLNFLRSLNASSLDVFLTLRIQSSLPYLFSAFKVSIPLSVIGAVIGEWFSADQGLGSVIIVAHSNLDMVTLFGAIFVLAFMGVSLTILVSLIERKVLFWHESSIFI